MLLSYPLKGEKNKLKNIVQAIKYLKSKLFSQIFYTR